MADSETNARDLRKNLTPAERRLWRVLRLRQVGGFKFRRQFPIGRYIADFACLERKLVIEVDGGQHSEQENYDADRTAWLESRGFRVVRIWNNEVQNNLDGVKAMIFNALTVRIRPRHEVVAGDTSSAVLFRDTSPGKVAALSRSGGLRLTVKGEPPTPTLPHIGGGRSRTTSRSVGEGRAAEGAGEGEGGRCRV